MASAHVLLEGIHLHLNQVYHVNILCKFNHILFFNCNRSTRERRVRQGGSTLNRSSGSPESSLIDNTIMIATPPSRNVQVVDLDSWNPPPPTSTTVNRTRRPLEVDLTCELDDEVFVVLEDIINPSRRPPANPLPVELVGHSSRTEMNAATSTRRGSAVSTGQTSIDLYWFELVLEELHQ